LLTVRVVDAVCVRECVGEFVAVRVGVAVLVLVRVAVKVFAAVDVIVRVLLIVGVFDGVRVLVGVGGMHKRPTCDGLERFVLSHTPSCPTWLSPQQYASPLSVMPQACAASAEKSVNVTPSGMATATGTLLFVVVSSPS